MNDLDDKPPFLIGWIVGFLRWFELLIFTISAPVLIFATTIAVTDLISGGRLLEQLPGLVFVYGVAFAAGIDTQLPAAGERIRDAWEEKHWGRLLFWFVLAVWTGAVIFTALRAFSIEQSLHVSEAEALRLIGIDADIFNTQRDALAVVLIFTSGFARWRKRKATQTEQYASEREYLEHEIENEPLRQRLNAIKLHGVAGAARGVREVVTAAVTRSDDRQPASSDVVPVVTQEHATRPLADTTAAQMGSLPSDDDPPPSGPPQTPTTTPENEERGDNGTTTQEDFPSISPYTPNIRLIPTPTPDKRRAQGKLSRDERRERAAFDIIRGNPAISASELKEIMHCRWSTADKWIRDYWRQNGKSSHSARG